jgi:putative protease
LLRKHRLKVARHLSLLATCMNQASVEFFVQLGVSRIVLPRSLSVSETESVTRAAPSLDYEVLALNDDCEFIDGFCGFYHGTAFPPGQWTNAVNTAGSADGLPRVFSFDLAYAGHGCELPFRIDGGGVVRHRLRDNVNRPSCAACALPSLSAARIRHLKIGGRGLPLSTRLRAVRFLRRAVEVACLSDAELAGGRLRMWRELYASTFGSGCQGHACYYPTSQ